MATPGASLGRHLGGPAEALKANSLHCTRDPGLCAGGGAPRTSVGHGPGGLTLHSKPRHSGSSSCSLSLFSSLGLRFLICKMSR